MITVQQARRIRTATSRTSAKVAAQGSAFMWSMSPADAQAALASAVSDLNAVLSSNIGKATVRSMRRRGHLAGQELG